MVHGNPGVWYPRNEGPHTRVWGPYSLETIPARLAGRQRNALCAPPTYHTTGRAR